MSDPQRYQLVTQNAPVTIFTSYSHRDAARKKDLEQFLEQYLAEKGQYVRLLSDENLQPGDEWAKRLQGMWAEADIFLVLVSEAYLVSTRKEPELAFIHQRVRENTQVKVLPVILEPCDWKHSSIAAYQALKPFERGPGRYADQAAAYREIGGAVVALAYFLRNVVAVQRLEQEKREQTGVLDLANCQLPFIPRELLEMPWLEELRLERNSIDRIEHLDRLPKLRQLVLSENSLEQISGLEDLQTLRVLDLRQNNIRQLGGLQNNLALEVLGLSNNQLRSLNGLPPLPRLRVLYAAHNYLEHVEELAALPALRRVVLTNNLLQSLRPLLAHIRGGLPVQWRYSFQETEEGIFVKDNHRLAEPAIEVVEKGGEAVLKYFDAADRFGQTKLEMVKLVLVGNSGVGKTNLSQFLRGKRLRPTHESTHLLDIQRFDAPFLRTPAGRPVCINIFDFGGQDYYHDSHRLYYSHDTVYVLLWDHATNGYGRREEALPGGDTIVYENYPLEYWLESIRYNLRDKQRPVYRSEADGSQVRPAAQPTESAPILVLQNKIDEHEAWLDQQRLQSCYPGIIGFFNVALQAKKRTRLLPEVLADYLSRQSFSGRQLINYEYKIVKRYLGAPEQLPFRIIELDAFWQECRDLIADEQVAFTRENAQIIAQILSTLGLVYYDRGRQGQPELIFTRVDVLNRGIKDILLVAKQGRDQGYFSRRDISHVGAAEPLLRLLENNQSIIRIGEERFLAPQFLPLEPDASTRVFMEAFTYCQLRYVYQAYFHKNLLATLFDRHMDQQGGRSPLIWRDGIVISRQQQLVLVQVVKEARQHVVYVRTMRPFNPTGLEGDIAATLTELNKSYGYDDADEQTAPYLPEGPRTVRKQVSVDGRAFFDVEQLRWQVRHKVFDFVHPDAPASAPDGPGREPQPGPAGPRLPARLFNVYEFKNLVRLPTAAKKLFISYSSRNAEFVQRLVTHLTVLRNQGYIAPWYDRMIKPGTRWDDAIKGEMERADVFVFLLSPDFLATEYIMQTEVPLAMHYAGARPDGAGMFLIELQPCDWRRTELHHYQQTHDPAKARKEIISIGRPDNDEAWTRVINELVKQFLGPPPAAPVSALPGQPGVGGGQVVEEDDHGAGDKLHG